jgi:hypothetical protein
MHDEQEAIAESARAIQEVARTSGKAIDAVEKLSKFVAKNISSPLEQAIGIVKDKLIYMRWERQLRLMERAEEFMQEVGIDAPTRALQMKLAIPLFQAASLEEDDALQDLWAKLLVNAIDGENGIDLQRAHISILEQLTPLEVRILERIYSIPFEGASHKYIKTFELPEKTAIYDKGESPTAQQPSNQVKLALANLDRLGCLAIVRSLGGGEIYSMVNQTLMGRMFVDACTLRTDRKK